MVKLPNGLGASTHYQLDLPTTITTSPTTPPANELVVCVNGINDFSVRFDLLAARLTAAGKAVLRYDPYGRGYSDPLPKGVHYDEAAHCTQLSDLVQHAGFKLGCRQGKPKVTLIGHSMGGLTALLFTEMCPELVGRLILMAPAGVMKPPAPGYSKLQWAVPSLMASLLSCGTGPPPPGDFHAPESTPEVAALSVWKDAWDRANTNDNGKLPFASSAARMPMTRMKKRVVALAANTTFPVLLMRADADPMVVLRPKDVCHYAAAFGSDRFTDRLIKGAGHCFHLEKHAETTTTILAFLE
jgi:pimeloyl-ACP methyl ester carboxylesterase